ncbi:helix-turn-helix domain-containing protein [Aurantiacibacter sp. MUD11]|uniref:winged helix-turn-helix transcriptional regulator n=1 Tax=Aurantiacibacter sp. MUD11 TaxID=3003265 RepID=UPI0022AAFE38|nr:helix-turn-helix domain-containing protein [Aurantiacibacter sp. MUD11]WAT16798.1 helix-turn-helix domain-containing protein [Aurantiacibacter sp. MUD11]
MGIREPLRELGCGLPHALEVMGERWSFLILRAAYNGLVHFEEFSSELGIARNILSNRLAKLVEHGVLARTPCEADRRKVEYRLTEKGLDLLPAMLALRQWGERYAENFDPGLVLVDCRDGQPVAPIGIRAHDGRELSWHELAWQTPDKIGQPVKREDMHRTSEDA